jgi:hypothetical protein
MKQAIISFVVGFSKWLHGEGGKHFRTYTYPRIKRRTRQFVNLGIYELIERGYKIIDDTYYKGAIEPLPPQVLQAQKEGENLAVADEMADTQPVRSSTSLPGFEYIFDGLPIWKGLEQGRTYRCGTFTMNNMLRTAMIRRGLRPPLEVTAIDPLYVFTKHGKGKTGTVMNHAFRWLAENGFPIPAWNPSMTDHNTELADLESNKNVENAKLFPSIRATGNVRYTYSFDEAVALDQSLPMNYEMQVSISFNQSIKYWGNKVPFVQKINGKYDFKRTGGHSVHGVRASFSTWEDGEPGFAIIDSAYRSSEDGWRFVKKRLMDYGLVQIRFVELDLTGETVDPDPITPKPTPDPTPAPGFKFARLASVDTQFGERNNNVTLLQQYLIEQGHSVPAGATGYFGEQTRTALKEWQDKQFPGNTYSGGYWGSISRERFIRLHNLG